MKLHYLALAAILIPIAASAANTSVQMQMLDSQIQKLEDQIKADNQKLQECAKKTKGFKIAGAVTLGLTAVGIAANVVLAVQIKKLKDSVGTGNRVVVAD